jgi:hypothetical protein
MKKKMMTAGLLIVVLAVWGIIIYRVIAAYSQSDVPEQVPEETLRPKGAGVSYNYVPDTSGLRLSYADPFGITRRSDTAQRKSVRHELVKLSQAATPVLKPAFDWSFVRYSGFITQNGGKVISVLTVSGTTVMLTEGEAANGVKLLKNLRDSVKISFNNKIKFIHRIAG